MRFDETMEAKQTKAISSIALQHFWQSVRTLLHLACVRAATISHPCESDTACGGLQ